MARKNVSAAEVRAWGRENLNVADFPALGANARGRIGEDSALVKAFHKANKGKVYAEKVAEARTVTVPVIRLDKAGRKVTRQETVTTSEARTVLGRPLNQKGRLPLGLLSEALSARAAAEVAADFK